MKNLRARNVIQLILNVIVTGLVFGGFACSIKDAGGFSSFNWNSLYTNIGFLTNILVGLFALIGVISNIVRIIRNKPTQCGFVYAFDLMIAVLAVAYIGFFTGLVMPNSDIGSLSTNRLIMYICFYIVAPAIFALSFLFFELEKVRSWGYSLLAPLLFVVYSGALVLCQSYGWMSKDLYKGFFDIAKYFNNEQWWRAAVMIATIIIGGYFFGFIFLVINRSMSKSANPLRSEKEIEQSFSGGEPVQSFDKTSDNVVNNSTSRSNEIIFDNDPNRVEVEPEIIPEENIVKKAKRKATQFKNKIVKKVETVAKAESKRVYHISKRRDNNMWQVKFANGKKAIKFFKTQAEAVEYAKGLTETQGGSIRVHSLKGKIKKNS